MGGGDASGNDSRLAVSFALRLLLERLAEEEGTAVCWEEMEFVLR
jgi:hypothetical protein